MHIFHAILKFLYFFDLNPAIALLIMNFPIAIHPPITIYR